MTTYSTKEYLSFGLFADDKDGATIACRSVKMVRVRKPHACHLSYGSGKPHEIAVGDLARFEKSIYDGEWMSWYCCIPCLDKWIKEWENG